MNAMRLRLAQALTSLLLALSVCLATPAGAGTGTNEAAMKAYQEALRRLEAGDQTAAETGFRRAAELAPRWGAPNARLGALFQLQGREEPAREQYAAAQSVSFPESPAGTSSASDDQRSLLIANEAYVAYLVNSARLECGQSILVPDPTVSIVARRHSDEMRDLGYFSHTSPTAGLATVQDRFRAVLGYNPRCIGENVSRRWGSAFSLVPAKILQTHFDLMASPGHKRNILHASFEWIGVGLSVNSKGDYWLTEVFVESGR